MNDIEVIEADMEYWTLRVAHEMPTPKPKTFEMLGRAAYMLYLEQELEGQETKS